MVYNDGMGRLCTSQYEPPNAQNMKSAFMHLTNYALNKQNDEFEYNEDLTRDD